MGASFEGRVTQVVKEGIEELGLGSNCVRKV